MSKKRLSELPQTIYVRIERPERDEAYLIASENGVYGAMDGDGPELIGVYTLEKTLEAVRVVKFEEVK